jgi:hypothetical protein
MSAPHDERLALPVEEGALLWCIRIWVIGLQRPIRAAPRIAEMLTRLGAPEAAAPFEAFMAAIRGGATCRIDVDCMCQLRVGPAERTLLDVLSLAQDSRPAEALRLLHGLVTPEAARAALRSAEALGTALARSGRYLPSSAAELRRFAGHGPIERPAGSTLH